MSSSPSAGVAGRLGTSPSAAPADTRKSGHSRQSSAGRIIESGLSLMKGHSRRGGSDQNTTHKRQESDGKRPTSKLPPSSAPNPFDEPSKPTKTVSLKPAKAESANPFDEPSSGAKNLFDSDKTHSTDANPFESKPSNPFEEKASNPFEESTPNNPFEDEPSNPFMDEPKSRSKPSNPFEEKAVKNPFE